MSTDFVWASLNQLSQADFFTVIGWLVICLAAMALLDAMFFRRRK